MKQFLWKLNRLRRMQGAEIGWRVSAALNTAIEAQGAGLATRPPSPIAKFGAAWLDALPRQIDAAPYCKVADALLAGSWQVFTLQDLPWGFPPHWNRHPKTGRAAPMKFGKRIDYRNEQAVGGSIKYLWEINRHLELVTLAQAFYLSGEQRYLQGCRVFLESWFEQCPYPLGLNWTSSLEHAVRLANWMVAWHLLQGEASPLFADAEGARFQQRWLDSIYQHCHFIAGHFSLHSSANNHLLGEYMGLFLASITWPCWAESASWRESAKVGLEEEGLKQNAPDGVNREQATWYHHEVADMMLLCGLAGRANGQEFSPAFWRRLEAMLGYIAALMDVAGRMPMFGDADDAVMVRFSREPDFNVFHSLLATGAVLFERKDCARKAPRCDDKTRWLLGDGAVPVLDELRQAASINCDGNCDGSRNGQNAFPDGGYYILGDALDTPEEIRLLADAGPLGYLSIAAHGHADALSFTLSAAGCEWLLDPGTYVYHAAPIWRDYFRSTAAHNTVCIDHLDQSEIGGAFLWLRAAQARCLVFESGAGEDRFVAEHDGYLRLEDPVLHQREICLHKAERLISVVDTLTCRGQHHAALHWHFSEKCTVDIVANRLQVRQGARLLEMYMPDTSWAPTCRRGAEHPPAGWVSRRYDEKIPIPSVAWQGLIAGTTVLRTEIKLSH